MPDIFVLISEQGCSKAYHDYDSLTMKALYLILSLGTCEQYTLWPVCFICIFPDKLCENVYGPTTPF